MPVGHGLAVVLVEQFRRLALLLHLHLEVKDGEEIVTLLLSMKLRRMKWWNDGMMECRNVGW